MSASAKIYLPGGAVCVSANIQLLLTRDAVNICAGIQLTGVQTASKGLNALPQPVRLLSQHLQA